MKKLLQVLIRLPGKSRKTVKEVIELCKSREIVGASVIQTLYGLGEHEYEFHILARTPELPQIIEIIGEPQQIKSLISELKQLVDNKGLITIQEVYTV